jgi:hypothetical protein
MDGDGLAYDHAIASLALCEAYMLSGDPELRTVAQRAVDFTLKSKNPYLAWRYSYPPDGDNDTSVTVWMAWALATAKAVDLVPPKDDVGRDVTMATALKEAVAWVEKMTEPEFGRTGYQTRGGSPARLRDVASQFPPEQSEAMTGAGVVIRLLAGHTPADDEFIVKGADLLKRRRPDWDAPSQRLDFCNFLWGSAAMSQVGDAYGDHWRAWSNALMPLLVRHQRGAWEGCARGSWDPLDAWSPVGGRVYATAMCCMTLESAWRWDPFFEKKPKKK